jgi:hypothetical protein
MISALMLHASTQSILDFTPSKQIARGKWKVRDDGLHQPKLPFMSLGTKGKGKTVQQTQEGRLMEMAAKKLGKLGFALRSRLDSYIPAPEIVSFCQVHVWPSTPTSTGS